MEHALAAAKEKAEKSKTNTKKLSGRPKGIPNKISSTAKDNVLAVFNRLDGTAGMAKWAAANPTEFYKIYARLIPAEMKADVEHSGKIEFGWLP